MSRTDKLLGRRPEGCLSEFTMERYLSGELAPTEAAPVERHVEGCAACGGTIDAMRKIRWRPDPAIVDAIVTGKPMRARPVRRLGRPPVLVAAAAALLVLVSAPLIHRQLNERTAVREKGGAVLRVFVKTPDGSRPGDSGERLRQGDAIKFAVNPGEDRYVMVVNVEERGRVTRYHPQRGESAPIEPRRETLLPASITLDDYRGLERIFAVFSPEPLSFDEVAAAVAKAAGTGGRLDLRAITTLPLAHPQASFLVSKE